MRDEFDSFFLNIVEIIINNLQYVFFWVLHMIGMMIPNNVFVKRIETITFFNSLIN